MASMGLRERVFRRAGRGDDVSISQCEMKRRVFFSGCVCPSMKLGQEFVEGRRLDWGPLALFAFFLLCNQDPCSCCSANRAACHPL